MSAGYVQISFGRVEESRAGKYLTGPELIRLYAKPNPLLRVNKKLKPIFDPEAPTMTWTRTVTDWLF